MSESQHTENQKQMEHIEKMEHLEKEYLQYLKENKEMNDKYPEVYQQHVTFIEWFNTNKES